MYKRQVDIRLVVLILEMIIIRILTVMYCLLRKQAKHQLLSVFMVAVQIEMCIRDSSNDAKAVGPFIMASLEWERLFQKNNCGTACK